MREKKEVVGLLNRVLKISEKIIEEDIETYSTEHIDFLFQKSESDIVYKMKQQEIFFLIEHQRTIDYNMPKRILEYEVEIIKEATKGKRMTKKHHKLPSVIPIVIYTGSGKWNVEKYIQECQEVLQGANRVKLGEYYVLDANDYTNEELQKDNFFFSKMLLLEKLNKEEEIVQVLSKMIENERGEENRLILKRIITLIMKGKLSFENREMLYHKLEEEETDMVIEVLQKENERQRRLGMAEILRKSVRNMLQFGEEDEKIMKYMEISKDELEKIKRKLAKS